MVPGPQIKEIRTLSFLQLSKFEKQSVFSFSSIAQGLRYWHFLSLTMVRTPLPELQKMKWPYLGSWATNHKTNDTLIYQTFQVEEKKVSLFFWFVTQELRYGHFIFWTSVSEVRIIVKGRKCQYLGPWAINKKTKDTLLSQTLKVEKKKVSLSFWFVAQELKYGHFIFWTLGGGVRYIVTGKKANMSAFEP